MGTIALAVIVSFNRPINPAATTSASGKIPITTSSEEAKKEFLQGRDLAERLLIQDSIQHFDKALSLDPNFALAELNRANSSPTAKEFFDHLKKAVSLADKASRGEKLLILGTEAGANGNAAKQKEYLEQLVAAYPNDERAQFNLGGYYFGQQDLTQAIEHYKKATELAPSYAPAYNILGYAYRQNADYANAEQAFKKYIELIPNYHPIRDPWREARALDCRNENAQHVSNIRRYLLDTFLPAVHGASEAFLTVELQDLGDTRILSAFCLSPSQQSGLYRNVTLPYQNTSTARTWAFTIPQGGLSVQLEVCLGSNDPSAALSQNLSTHYELR